ncbi:MAG TPA: hypothetical protein VN886_17950 [Acidimicrobiales bacterium]|nr:hypothetical protein [Acidimicrobiales bacterium]
MSVTVILILLIISAAAELFGTVTVAITYAKGHRLAQELLIATGPPVRRITGAEILEPPLPGLRMFDLEGNVDNLRYRVSNQLRGRWWITAGLIAYGLGAFAGLGAGLLALYH